MKGTEDFLDMKDQHEGSRIAMQRIVANLDASGISKDLFLSSLWMMGAC